MREQKGVPAELLFKRVGDAVRSVTGSRQQPWYENGLTGADFCFGGCGTGLAPVVPGKEAAPSNPAPPALDPDTALWVEITSVDGTCAGYERYRKQFPNGKYIAQAGRILARAPCVAPAAATTPPVIPGKDATASATRDPSAGNGAANGAGGGMGPGSSVASLPAAGMTGGVVAGSTFRDRLRDGSVGPQMVWLPAGNFKMGSPSGEAGRSDDEGPQRDVRISRPFAVGQFEVTWAEYDLCVAAKACPAAGGDQAWGKGARPVINVSWNDAKAYATWLSQETGKTYRLLSEAEWEYAARAGTTTPFSTGANISTAQANYDGNYPYNGAAKGEYRQKTIPVGSFQANRFGLHDMHGNVWEWVEDCYEASYSAGQTSDGSAFTKSSCSSRAIRGGSWSSIAQILRSAGRNRYAPDDRSIELGFRLARSS